MTKSILTSVFMVSVFFLIGQEKQEPVKKSQTSATSSQTSPKENGSSVNTSHKPTTKPATTSTATSSSKEQQEAKSIKVKNPN